MVASNRSFIGCNAAYIATVIMLAKSTWKACEFADIETDTDASTGICVAEARTDATGRTVVDATDAKTVPTN